MPISAIDLFRPTPKDGVQDILSSGVNILNGALNNAIQIGRDSANLRATQEREFLAERERITNLAQRRAELVQQQQNTDRSFAESVLRDRRDFNESAARDTRDFSFKQNTDARDFALRSLSVGTQVANTVHDNTLADKEFQLEQDKVNETKSFLRTRANDILDTTKAPSFIERVFGTAKEAAPTDALTLGKELKSIGVTLRDPQLITRGDELVSKGVEGVAADKARIRATPLPPRPSTKKVVTDTEKETLLSGVIKDYSPIIGVAPDALVSMTPESLAKQLDSPDNINKFTATDRIKVMKAVRELQDLRAKKTGKTADSTEGSAAKSDAERLRDLILKRK